MVETGSVSVLAGSGIKDVTDNRREYWETRHRSKGPRAVGNCSFTEDRFRVKTAEVLMMLEPVIKPIFRGRICLDFGAGWGRISKLLSGFCFSIYGIDISPWAVRQARLHAPECTFMEYDGQHIPFKDRFFQGCLSWTVLQHVPPEQVEGICREIDRVLCASSPLVLYENVSTWCGDKPYIWFRDEDRYKELFPGYSIERESIVRDFDSTGENHVLLILRKRGNG